jgi:chemotaxis protein MotB
MRHNKCVYGIFLICLLLVACVSKDSYEELEATLAETRAELEQKSSQIKELKSNLKHFEEELRQSEENRKQLQQNLSALQAQTSELENTNLQLAQRLTGLGIELEKKDSVVLQKEDMIKQHNESKRALETKLQALESQIDHREQKIKNQEATLATLENTKSRIETKIKQLESQLDSRETRINEQDSTIKNLQSTKRQIETDLKKQIKNHQIKLEEMEGNLKVTFIDKILFDSGSVRINKNGQELLLTLAESLRENHNQNIIIQGHTDNVEIGPELRKFYPTNWELSATRSTTVLRYLIESAGIAPERCAASAYSYYKPVASNQSEAGRKQNRRIEIILVPQR